MLFFKTIEPQVLWLLKRIQALPELADTRLVGGTALALQLGHRVSVDLDVFGKWDYSKDLTPLLSTVGQVEKESGTPDGRMAFFFIDGVKVDFVSYEMYQWLEPPVVEEGVCLAGFRDIASMKINAIVNRGSRKDFIDLARLLDDYSLEDMFEWYLQKYPEANPALALRSLSYFVDAETMPMPRMMIPLDWSSVKEKVQAAVRDFIYGAK
ncbi:MAG: nucleotidyl transferase AbiEii/AbiGii toxin family protein [Victivallales bacterium]|nr:nucleotidyl transferase AbiEii/AbiGii toxin family protein [Victivallales bacterium]